jgi:triacylglycerol lipase
MSPARRRVVLGLVFVLVLGLVIGVGTALRERRRTPESLVPQGRPGPVLLVPGYGGKTASLQTLATVLRARGRQVQIIELLGDGTGDLRAEARRLQAAVDAAVAAGAPSVDVVGYSAGGVVARVWADDLGGVDRARRVVTLGSPHHGTKIAQAGAALAPDACPPACQQLVPGSELLDGLDETPDGPVWTSLWTAQDRTVTPPDSARLDGALNIEVQDICSDAEIQHSQLSQDPLVIGLVLAALGPQPLTSAPSPDQCTALRKSGA